MVVGGTVAFTFAAAHDAYPVRPRLAVVADERHLAVPDDVIDTPVLERLRTRPHLHRTFFHYYYFRFLFRQAGSLGIPALTLQCDIRLLMKLV